MYIYVFVHLYPNFFLSYPLLFFYSFLLFDNEGNRVKSCFSRRICFRSENFYFFFLVFCIAQEEVDHRFFSSRIERIEWIEWIESLDRSLDFLFRYLLKRVLRKNYKDYVSYCIRYEACMADNPD
jgi:hypothetical protein